MGFRRIEGGWRFDLGSLKTNTAADEMPPNKYPYLQNVRYVKSLQTRPGYVTLFGTSLTIQTECPLPTGEVGVAYSATLVGIGGIPPYTWTIDSGTLPTGLSLSSGGVISGTPSVAVGGSFVIRLTDDNGTFVLKSCQLTIVAAVAITTTCPLPDGEVGVAYDEQFAATGGVLPYVWSITAGALPTGLSMDSDGHVTGTPTLEEVATFTVQVVDALGGSDTLSCQITVAIPCFDFTDDFNRADGSLGTDWTVFHFAGSGIDPQIISNQLACAAVALAEVSIAPLTDTTGYAECTWSDYVSIKWGGPMVQSHQVPGPNYFYYTAMLDDLGGAEPRGRLRIMKYDGTLATLATLSPTPLAGIFGHPVRLSYSVQATKVVLTAFINGVQVLTVDDSTGGRFTSGRPGFAMSSVTSPPFTPNSWDNFVAHSCP